MTAYEIRCCVCGKRRVNVMIFGKPHVAWEVVPKDEREREYSSTWCPACCRRGFGERLAGVVEDTNE